MTSFNYLKINKTKKIRYLKHLKKNTTYIVFLHGFMSDLEGKKPKTFLDFAKKRKKFWLLPIIFISVIIGALFVFTQGSVVAPFIYTLF